jgi:hypothetical protein
MNLENRMLIHPAITYALAVGMAQAPPPAPRPKD